MKFLSKLKGYIFLIFVAIAIGYYCIVGIFRIKVGKSKQQIANNYFRKGSIKILKIIRANYQINFLSSFNQENVVDSAYIFMSNHLSHMDLPLIYATMFGTIRVIAKERLFRIPLFGKALRATGIISIDKDNPDKMQDFYSRVKKNCQKNVWLWIFPEGTRSLTGELQPLKLGGFSLAKELNAKIIPVGITGTNLVLPPRTLNLSLNQKISINIGEPIDVTEFNTPETQKILVQKVSDAIRTLSKPT